MRPRPVRDLGHAGRRGHERGDKCGGVGTFSEAMDAATIDGGTFELRDAGNVLVPATVSYNSATYTAVLAPSSSLDAADDLHGELSAV